MRNQQNVKVKVNSSFETICPFPVGYVYMSSKSTSPASIYGGTWSAFTDGRFLRPSGSWNSTGGEEKHVLTVNEMPAHTHNIKAQGPLMASGSSRYAYVSDTENWWSSRISSTGGNAAHNNLPPYRTCYCWYRTA